MAAQADGVAERGDEHFAVRAGSKMVAEFSADLRGELVVDVGGQSPEDIQATAFARLMVMNRWLLLARASRLLLGHVSDLPGS